MNTQLTRRLLIPAILSLLCACSVDKLEARLEANPQCKDVVNPKTGALMPCPGSDKSFYREAGLVTTKPTVVTPTIVTNNQTAPAPSMIDASSATKDSSNTSNSSAASPAKSVQIPTDCKPQIHKKTGGTLPCPAQD